ncbi:MAG: serine hydrolase [Candidatus Nanoarchaeia archaeon]
MKKILITLGIVAAVAAAHYFAIKMMVPKNEGKNEEEKSKDAKVLGMEPNTPPAQKIPDKSRPLPYSYKNAVTGNIKELPDSTNATTGILVDLGSRNVLWAKNPRTSVPIASMTKMMTALLIFEELATRKDISLDTVIPVTPTAMKIGGSQIYLDVKESFPISDLLKSVMIVSANDSSELLAEYFSNGNVPVFVARMNQRAKELMLPGAKFFNPTGLPGASSAEDNVCSPEGLVLLAEMLMRHPKAVEWASTWIDYIRKDSPKPFMMRNHNRLVNECPGVNGMKTGFINRSGFCTTVTCDRGGVKLACAVTGFKTRKERDEFVKKLLDWGYKKEALMPKAQKQEFSSNTDQLVTKTPGNINDPVPK